jgi:replicative DNA helicase
MTGDDYAAPEDEDYSDFMVRDGNWILDAPSQVPAVWGEGDDVLWAGGEPLLVAGPTGVGKTSLLERLTLAAVGLSEGVLGYPVAKAERVLYLACDRPQQPQRSFARMVDEDDRDVLNQRLVVWARPTPYDLAQQPKVLLKMAEDADADAVFIDSYKDVALRLSDDAVGAALNNALQHVISEGVEVCGAHHTRKPDKGQGPSLDLVYGSTWLTAGCGSVIMLWGAAGDLAVRMLHFKQPAAEVGPLWLVHNPVRGTITIDSDCSMDPLTILRAAKDGLLAVEMARALFTVEQPSQAQVLKARRKLDTLVKTGQATRESEDAEGLNKRRIRYLQLGISQPYDEKGDHHGRAACVIFWDVLAQAAVNAAACAPCRCTDYACRECSCRVSREQSRQRWLPRRR